MRLGARRKSRVSVVSIGIMPVATWIGLDVLIAPTVRDMNVGVSVESVSNVEPVSSHW
jgi:hypothetical protein